MSAFAPLLGGHQVAHSAALETKGPPHSGRPIPLPAQAEQVLDPCIHWREKALGDKSTLLRRRLKE
jgi:hypothetical protein